MVESFGTALAAVLEAADMTQMRFAAKVGLNQGQLSRILAGKRRPPLVDLPRWFELLGATKTQREHLLLLAHLDHATPWLRIYVADLHHRASLALNEPVGEVSRRTSRMEEGLDDHPRRR